MSDADIQEMNNWLRSEVIRIARENIPKNATQSERDEMLQAGIIAASGVSVTKLAGQRMLASIEGWARLVWQMCHRNHPDVTVEQFRAMMTDPANMREASRVFEDLTGGPVKNSESPAPNRKARRATKSQTRRKST
jgi:hypothetical protein